jgi:hypothetical protein
MGCVAFPVRNRRFVYADLFSNVLLKEFEAEAAGADMVAYSFDFSWVMSWLGSKSSNLGMAERQRRAGPAVTSMTNPASACVLLQ